MEYVRAFCGAKHIKHKTPVGAKLKSAVYLVSTDIQFPGICMDQVVFFLMIRSNPCLWGKESACYIQFHHGSQCLHVHTNPNTWRRISRDHVHLHWSCMPRWAVVWLFSGRKYYKNDKQQTMKSTTRHFFHWTNITDILCWQLRGLLAAQEATAQREECYIQLWCIKMNDNILIRESY